jgi:hypothetical protein
MLTGHPPSTAPPAAAPDGPTTLDDLLADPELLALRGSPEEAAATRILSGVLRPVRADELAAAILVDHPCADPWKATRILGAVLEAREARHRPTMRQVVDDLAGAGAHVSLGLVEDTVARARAVGLRTEGCHPYRTGAGLPRRQRCEYRSVHWTPATVAVTADRQVRAAILLAARLLRDLGALAVRTVARAVRRGARALLDLWRRLRGGQLRPAATGSPTIAPTGVNTVSRAESSPSLNTEVRPPAPPLVASVNVAGLAGQRPSSPEGGPGGTGHTHQSASRPRRPSRQSRLLGELLGEHAARVREGNVLWTAASLLRIAVGERWTDPLRAALDAYAIGVSIALSDGAERERSQSPIRNPATWAATVARRILHRAEPPPWPERYPPRPVIPPESPPAPASPASVAAAAAMPLLEVAPAAAPGGPALAAEADRAAWDALDAVQRTRAEALVRQQAPALVRWTHEQGHFWRQAVLTAAHHQRAEPGRGESG